MKALFMVTGRGIGGDAAVALNIANALSKYGFECAKVDHTGIDLIARNPKNNEIMGISVKSRSRSEGTEKLMLILKLTIFEKLSKAQIHLIVNHI